MFYNVSLGMQGNIEKAMRDVQNWVNSVFNEASQRDIQDSANRTELEQQATDQYLDLVQAQQDITDIQLQLLEG